MQAEDYNIVFNRQANELLRKYRLDNKNHFHRLVVHQIIREFQPFQDPNYDIKLSDRLKKSQGREVNLLPYQNLLPRRDPVYTQGIYPLKNAFVLYGVDRMSRKDIYKFINPNLNDLITLGIEVK